MNLRKAARRAPCFIRLPGCAPGLDNETVVLCHRKGGGVARKVSDEDAVTGCFNCHLKLDGPESSLPEPYDAIFDRAKRLTHKYFRRRGLILYSWFILMTDIALPGSTA